MSLINPAIGRTVTRRYLLALGLIACLSTGLFLTLSVITSAEDKRSVLMREVAHQQATSQRIAFFANAYAASDSKRARLKHHRELVLAIKNLARTQQRLISRRDQAGFNPGDRAGTGKLYFSGSGSFDVAIEQFLADAKTVVGLPLGQVRKDHPSLSAINRAAMISIPQGYRSISDALKDESEQTIRGLGQVVVGTWLATLLLLVLVGLFIFRPLARRVGETVIGLAAAESKARAAAADAATAMRSRSRFFATMSHEIRTPLNAAIGATGLLLETELDERQQGYVRIARGAGEHLLGLVNDILDLNKLEWGKLTLDDGEFSLVGEINRVADMIGPEANSKGLSLSVECDPSATATVHGDSKRLRQVLVNLVGNAVKFTQTGSVTVSAEVANGAAGGVGDTVEFIVRIADTGIGIAKADVPRLFQDFQQLDTSTTRNYEGSGLGLAISRRIVELMGGEIGVASTPGQGSTFWFTVPLEIAAPADNEVGPEAPARSVGPFNVLVAEDNKPNQIIVRHLLESLGHTVTIATNGEDAIKQVQQGRFDAVLMDIEMPNLDGVEATKRIRALEGEYAQLPIIALTAHAVDEDPHGRIGHGFDGCLTKPIDATAIASTLGSVAVLRDRRARTVIPTEYEPRLFNAATFHKLSRIATDSELDDMISCLTASLEPTLQMMRNAVHGGDVAELCRLAESLAEASDALGGERFATIAHQIVKAPSPIAEFMKNADFLSGYGRETGREIELVTNRHLTAKQAF